MTSRLITTKRRANIRILVLSEETVDESPLVGFLKVSWPDSDDG